MRAKFFSVSVDFIDRLKVAVLGLNGEGVVKSGSSTKPSVLNSDYLEKECELAFWRLASVAGTSSCGQHVGGH